MSSSTANLYWQKVSTRTMSNKQNMTYEWAVTSLQANLSIMGLWEKPKNFKDKICNSLPILSINSFLISCHLVPQVWALCRIYKHLDLLLVHGMVIATFLFGILKMFFLLTKSNAIHSFFSRIKQDWNVTMTDYERSIMIKYWILIKKVHLCGFIFGISVPASYHGLRPLNILLRVPTNLTDTIPGRYLAFYTVYPYDTQPSPVFELTALHEALGGFIVCTACLVTDILYTAMVLHTCAQLDLLGSRIQAMDHRCENILKTIKFSVEHHLRIIRFAKDIDNVFSGIIFAVMFHFILGFCSQAFTGILFLTHHMTAKDRLIQFSFFIIYSVYLLFCPFVYCWAGEKLMIKSEDVSSAAFNCSWINFPPTTSKLLCLIIVRAQRPLAVTAGKFLPITLNTYTKLIKTCCGYISMLHALSS